MLMFFVTGKHCVVNYLDTITSVQKIKFSPKLSIRGDLYDLNIQDNFTLSYIHTKILLDLTHINFLPNLTLIPSNVPLSTNNTPLNLIRRRGQWSRMKEDTMITPSNSICNS